MPLFAPVGRLDRWAIIEATGYRHALTREFGAEPTTLGDLVDGTDAGFREEGRLGLVSRGRPESNRPNR